MASCLEALEARLREAGCQYEVLDHAPAMTTQEAAGAGAISGYAFAKAVVLITDDRPQLHVLRAADTVDLESARATLGAREARIAREGEFEYFFPGCDAGSPPPIPLVPNLAVRVDRRLLDNQQLTFEVGDSTHSIRVRTDDYLRVVGGQVADFAEVPARGRQRPQPAGFAWGTWTQRGAIAAGALFYVLLGRRLVGRLLPGRASRSFALGAASGAAALALADPRAGARRRHLIRDRTGAMVRRTAGWSDRKARYWRGKSQGVRHDLRDAMPGG